MGQVIAGGMFKMEDVNSVKALIINTADNVAVVLDDVHPGYSVTLQEGRSVTAKVEIPLAHKVALRRIDPGEAVIKYGETIGFAKVVIEEGEWVHTHNMAYEE